MKSHRTFKKRRSVSGSYAKQGLIYFTCLDYKNQPRHMQRKIENLCVRHGGSYYQALFETVTTDIEPVAVCMRHYISSQTTLNKLIKTFYESWV